MVNNIKEEAIGISRMGNIKVNILIKEIPTKDHPHTEETKSLSVTNTALKNNSEATVDKPTQMIKYMKYSQLVSRFQLTPAIFMSSLDPAEKSSI